MGKGQKTLSVPKKLWTDLEEILDNDKDVFEMWNVYQVSDLFKFCCRLGMKNLEQMIQEFRKAHKKTTETPAK